MGKTDQLFHERHEIIHRGKETTFPEEDIRTVLNAIKYMMKYLVHKSGPYQRSDGALVLLFEE